MEDNDLLMLIFILCVSMIIGYFYNDIFAYIGILVVFIILYVMNDVSKIKKEKEKEKIIDIIFNSIKKHNKVSLDLKKFICITVNAYNKNGFLIKLEPMIKCNTKDNKETSFIVDYIYKVKSFKLLFNQNLMLCEKLKYNRHNKLVLFNKIENDILVDIIKKSIDNFIEKLNLNEISNESLVIIKNDIQNNINKLLIAKNQNGLSVVELNIQLGQFKT